MNVLSLRIVVLLLIHVIVPYNCTSSTGDILLTRKCERTVAQRNSAGEESTNKSTIYFVVMVQFPDPLGREWLAGSYDDGHNIAPAVYLAAEQINNRSDLLKDYSIEVIQSDGGCNIAERTVIGFTEQIVCSSKPIMGIIGPSCAASASLVGQLTAKEELSLITVHSGGHKTLGNRSKTPHAYGVLGPLSRNVQTFIALMKRNLWTRIGIIYSVTSSFYYEIGTDILKQVELEGFEIAFASIVYGTYFPIEEIKQSFVRVTVLSILPQIARNILCLAFHHGLVFPNYQWITVQDIIEIVDTDFNYAGQSYKCSADDINSALTGGLFLFPELLSEKENKSLLLTDYQLTYKQYLAQSSKQTFKYKDVFGVNSSRSAWADAFYDATWTLAFALNNSLEDLNKDLTQYGSGSKELAEIVGNHITKLEFQGVSGLIKFDNDTGFNIGGIVNIFQYGENRTSKRIGFYNGTLILVEITSVTFVNATFPKKSTHLSYKVAVILVSLCVIAMLFALPIHAVNIAFQKRAILKSSNPQMNHFIFLGSYLVLLGITVLTVIETIDFSSVHKAPLCRVVPWTLSVGMTFIMGTVLSKTWKLYYIYVTSKQGRRIKDRQTVAVRTQFLIGTVIILVCCTILLCLIWTIVDPLKPSNYESIQIENSEMSPIILVDTSCKSRWTLYWLLSMFLFECLLALCSVCLAALTRINIKGFKNNEVVILVYLLAITFSLGVPLYTVVSIRDTSVDTTLRYAILCIFLCAVIYICLFVLFLPRIFLLIKMRLSH